MALAYSSAARLRAGDELGDVIDDLFSVHLSKQHAGAIGWAWPSSSAATSCWPCS